MFVRQPRMTTSESKMFFAHDIQPEENLVLLRDAITILDRCVAAARTHQGEPESKEVEASLNMMLGLGLVTVSEARALLLLLSIGLERSARIHLRSLYECQVRASLMRNPKTARAFRLAALSEVTKFAVWLKSTPAEIQAIERRFIGDMDEQETTLREKDALGGTMQTLLRRESGSDEQYAALFAHPSLFSHGSVLALQEISEAVQGKTDDFLDAVFSDGTGYMSLIEAAACVLEIARLLINAFGIVAWDDWNAVEARLRSLTAVQPAPTRA
jgi:hypothetical protein